MEIGDQCESYDRNQVFSVLMWTLSKCRDHGINVSLAPLYGCRQESVAIVLGNTELVDGKLVMVKDDNVG